MPYIHQSDWLTITDKADKTVEIDITGIIGGSFWEEDDKNSVNTKEKMRAELKAVASVKANKIIINIDSPGGNVYHGLSIHDLLAQNSAEKEVRIIGMAASIASVIAQVGDKRKISDNALFLIHRAMNLAAGNVNDFKMAIEDLNHIDTKIINIYTKRGANPEKINELMDANMGYGKWLDGKEAVDAGLIDEVFEPIKAAATFNLDFNKLKYPIIPENMSKKSEETRTLFDKMKDAFIAVFKAADDEAKIPQEVTDQLTNFDAKLKELETENSAMSEQLEQSKKDIADKDLKIQALSDEKLTEKTMLEEKLKEATALTAELRALKNDWKPESRDNTSRANADDKKVSADAVRENRKKLQTQK